MTAQTLAQTELRQKPLAQLLFTDLQHEFDTTRKFLSRVPQEHLDWKPHEKSFTLGQLAYHVAGFPEWGIMTLDVDVLDFAAEPQQERVVPTLTPLETFEQLAPVFVARLAEQTDGQLETVWTMCSGEQIYMQVPRAVALRDGIINHLVHHRAQLGVYFRLLNLPVPSAYGPTADEQ